MTSFMGWRAQGKARVLLGSGPFFTGFRGTGVTPRLFVAPISIRMPFIKVWGEG
jgi:hypothetical protein